MSSAASGVICGFGRGGRNEGSIDSSSSARSSSGSVFTADLLLDLGRSGSAELIEVTIDSSCATSFRASSSGSFEDARADKVGARVGCASSDSLLREETESRERRGSESWLPLAETLFVPLPKQHYDAVGEPDQRCHCFPPVLRCRPAAEVGMLDLDWKKLVRHRSVFAWWMLWV